MERILEFSINHWDLVLSLLFIIAMMFGGQVMRRIRGYHEVDASGAVMLINHQDALVLDVREQSELKDGVIVDSVHMPLSAFAKRVDEISNYKDKTVIVGCRSGHRSSSACAKLRKQGFENVYNLRGGIMAWKNANLPIEIPGKKRKKKR